MTDTVQTWHSAGKNAGSIAHTNGIGDIKLVEPCALLRDRIDMGCFYNGIAVTTQMIRAVLISDNEQEISLSVMTRSCQGIVLLTKVQIRFSGVAAIRF